jgi:hypothetical protein
MTWASTDRLAELTAYKSTTGQVSTAGHFRQSEADVSDSIDLLLFNGCQRVIHSRLVRGH